MAKKLENQDGPYEYERPLQSGAKLKAITISVAALAAAGTLAAGTAYAVNAVPQSDLTSISDSTVLSSGISADEPLSVLADDQADHSKEVTPPVNVIKTNFSSGDHDSDEDGRFQSSDDDRHDGDEAFESEDSEDH